MNLVQKQINFSVINTFYRKLLKLFFSLKFQVFLCSKPVYNLFLRNTFSLFLNKFINVIHHKYFLNFKTVTFVIGNLKYFLYWRITQIYHAYTYFNTVSVLIKILVIMDFIIYLTNFGNGFDSHISNSYNLRWFKTSFFII